MLTVQCHNSPSAQTHACHVDHLSPHHVPDYHKLKHCPYLRKLKPSPQYQTSKTHSTRTANQVRITSGRPRWSRGCWANCLQCDSLRINGQGHQWHAWQGIAWHDMTWHRVAWAWAWAWACMEFQQSVFLAFWRLIVYVRARQKVVLNGWCKITTCHKRTHFYDSHDWQRKKSSKLDITAKDFFG